MLPDYDTEALLRFKSKKVTTVTDMATAGGEKVKTTLKLCSTQNLYPWIKSKPR